MNPRAASARAALPAIQEANVAARIHAAHVIGNDRLADALADIYAELLRRRSIRLAGTPPAEKPTQPEGDPDEHDLRPHREVARHLSTRTLA